MEASAGIAPFARRRPRPRTPLAAAGAIPLTLHRTLPPRTYRKKLGKYRFTRSLNSSFSSAGGGGNGAGSSTGCSTRSGA